jgi:hypothetical protein
MLRLEAPVHDQRQARSLLMSAGVHKLRHVMLYRALYELLGDWVSQTPGAGPHRPIGELVGWSYEQTKAPSQSPLPLWHDEADFRKATLEQHRSYRRAFLLAAGLAFAVGLGSALLLLLVNF